MRYSLIWSGIPTGTGRETVDYPTAQSEKTINTAGCQYEPWVSGDTCHGQQRTSNYEQWRGRKVRRMSSGVAVVWS